MSDQTEYEPRNLYKATRGAIDPDGIIKSRAQLDAITRLGLQAYTTRIPHEADQTYTAAFTKQTRRANFVHNNLLLNAFDEIAPDPGKHQSRGIKLTKSVITSPEIADIALGLVKPAGQFDPITGRQRPEPLKAVKSRDANGNNATSNGLEIDAKPALQIEEMLTKMNDASTSEMNRRYLAYLLDSTVDGSLLTEYRESPAGRLHVIGGGLQTVPKAVRRVSLGGYEVDMSNCHPRILCYLSMSGGYTPTFIQHYISNTQEVRAQLAEELGISIPAAKQIILATLYGARPGFSLDAIVESEGADKGALHVSPTLKALAKDVRGIHRAVVGNAKTHRGCYINALGKGISVHEKTSRVVAHLAQGMEALLMRSAFNGVRIASWEHDGATVTDEPNLKGMEARIEADHGIRMPMEVKHGK